MAAAIAAVYPNLWLNDSLVMSETIAILLVALALLAGLRLEEVPTVARAAIIGGLVGLAALTRSELALLAPAVRGRGVASDPRPGHVVAAAEAAGRAAAGVRS